MLIIYRYIMGYLRIVFKGDNTERLLNICISHKIALWNSALTKNGIETDIYIKDFKKMRYFMRKSGVKVHILKKKGLPFKLAKNKKRSGLLVGFIFLICFLKIMSGFIWVIDVSGNKTVDDSEILAACRKIGITEGVKKSDIDTKSQREKLLLNIDSLAWASLNIEGSRLTVNVSEVKNKQDGMENAANIKASADGIIEKIAVSVGNCLVKSGDTVKKGDVLVSGIVETNEGTRFVRSKGEITAKITREISVSGEYEKHINNPTGETEKKRVLEIFTLKIPLYLGQVKGEYNSDLKIKNAKLFGQSLPIRVYEREFELLKESKIILEKDALIKELEEEILSSSGGESKELKFLNKEITENEKGLTLKALIETEESIGYIEEIKISN